jgi:general nucleoside transport system ATP-binding protein
MLAGEPDSPARDQTVLMLEMRNIHKSYGSVHANRGIDLSVPPGKIVGLLGENGSGKSTLMKVLFGVVRADSGTVCFKGRELVVKQPGDAIAAGIGMIHQHFMLVDAMSVTENVMLGWQKAGRWPRPRQLAELIRTTSRGYGLDIDPDATVGRLSYGQRQRVEIIKALMRGSDLLILDEPTSNLSPPEVSRLLDLMRRLREQGRSVIFISHKLGEVLDVCDDIVVLRDGVVTGRCPSVNATRAELAHMMVGRDVTAPIEPWARDCGDEILTVTSLSLRDEVGIERLRDVHISLHAGEILSVAGVDGNGQAELVEVIAGLRLPDRGRIVFGNRDVSQWNARARLAAGIAYIPVDRANMSLVLGMTVEDNLAMREFNRAPLSRWCWLDRKNFRAQATKRMAQFDVRASGPDAPARTLSGGNQQKVVVAREIGRSPKVLIAVQPTWGLDPGASRFVIDQVLALRKAGGAILYISSELEEVLTLGDRIAVMHNGRLSVPMPRGQADVTEIGLMMAGVTHTPQNLDARPS